MNDRNKSDIKRVKFEFGDKFMKNFDVDLIFENIFFL